MMDESCHPLRALLPRLVQIEAGFPHFPMRNTSLRRRNSYNRDEQAKGRLRDLARGLERQLVADRGMETEGQLLEVIRDLAAAESPLSVKKITALHGPLAVCRIVRKAADVSQGRLRLFEKGEEGVPRNDVAPVCG